VGFIRIKPITIIILIVLVTLLSFIVLSTRLIRQELQIITEGNNLEINRRVAMETEAALANIRSNSRNFIRVITTGTDNAVTQNAIEFFFEESPQVAAVFFTAGSQTDGIVINENFFRLRGIDEALAEALTDSFRDECETEMRRAAAGEMLLLNAAPHFIVPVLAMFFSWDGGGAGVLFSQAELDDIFCFGTNQSYLVNDSGDILIHGNFELVRDGVNVADNDFTQYVWDSEARNSQLIYTGEDGIRYFRAFTKLNTGGCAVITGIEFDNAFEKIAATIRSYIYLGVAFLLILIMVMFILRGINRG
jgi:adenylate cyclase